MDQEEDQPYHVPFTYRVGQRVLVTEAEPKAHAWYGEDYNPGAVGRAIHVGVKHKIEQEHPLYGFLCSAPKLTSLWYPSCALAPITEACIIEVPSVNEVPGGK